MNRTEVCDCVEHCILGLPVRKLSDTRHRFDGFDHVAMFRGHIVPHIGEMIGEHGGSVRNLHEGH